MPDRITPPFRMLTAAREQIEFVNEMRRQWYNHEALLAGNRTPEQVRKFLNTDRSLPQYIWKEWDREAIEILRTMLTIYNDLNPAIGRNIPVGISLHEFRRITDQDRKGIWSMDGRQRPDADKPLTDYIGTPVPIYANAWGCGWIEMEAERNAGYNNLDRYGRENVMRGTAEDLEDAIVNGVSDIVFNGQSMYGLLNHPKRKTVAGGVTLNGATGVQWKEAFAKVRRAASDVNVYGDLALFVNYDDWQYAMDTDYSVEYPNLTIAQRAMQVAGIGTVISTKNPAFYASDGTSNDTIVAIYKSRMTAEILSRMPLTTIPKFRSHPHDDFAFEVWASASLEVKYDINDAVGLVHYANTRPSGGIPARDNA